MDALKQGDKGAAGHSGSTVASVLDPKNEGATKQKLWVAVRIRPLLEQEQLARERVAWKAVEPNTLQHVDSDKSTNQGLSYDRVFSETCSSQQVYQDAAQSLLKAALEGYNGTILAYGQTGSGKTYTMQSIIKHAAKDIFNMIADNAGHEFVVRMTAVEIYNDIVHDLSRDNSTALKLLDDPAKGTIAESLCEAGVHSLQHMQQLLAEVESRRKVRATRIHNNSSRSHAMIRWYIERRSPGDIGNDVQRSDASTTTAADADGAADITTDSSHRQRGVGTVTHSSLIFVDLAGSERTSQAADSVERDKERLKEATSINKSLRTLSSVIWALADNPGKPHIPYRESKLTRLLQSSLSGNAHISLITTICPAASSLDDTRAALQFAKAAGRVMLKPQVNRLSANKGMIRAFHTEIEQLKVQLATLQSRQLDTRVDQQKAVSSVAAQEQDALQKKLQLLQSQILRGASVSKKDCCSLDCNGSEWQNRVAIARDLRASSKGLQSSWAPGDSSRTRDTGSAGGRPSTADRQQSSDDAAGSGSNQLRRSMRLLDCYLVRGDPEHSTQPATATGESQLQQSNPSAKQQNLQPQWQRLRQQRQQPGRQFSGASILEQAAVQHQQQQEAAAVESTQQQQAGQHSGSRLNPARQQSEEARIALQMQKLQEPSGPAAEAAMAGLEVEARCYKHVQDYTLDELVAALEHLECQQAAGEGLGSWSDEQLDALRSEVARKRAAEALTRMGDKALDALTRKVNSYTSSAEGSPFGDIRRQLVEGSSRETGMLDTPAAAAALASAAAAGMASWRVAEEAGGEEEEQQQATEVSSSANEQASNWSEAGPRLMSGRTTPTLTGRRNSGRAASVAVAPPGAAAATPATRVRRPSSASRQGGTSPANSSSSSAGSRRSTAAPASSAAAAAQEQLVRMQEAWRDSVEKDVSCLREVLAQYKEQVERLEMQKKLLLSQVLKLEFSLEEQEGRVSELQQQLHQSQRERDAARAASGGPGGTQAPAGSAPAAGGSSAAGDTPGGSGTPSTLPAINTSPPLHHLSIYDACSDDGWASTPTVDSLLPKIVAMWEELYVPLAYRSRFFLAFRGREVFYYEVEARRLEWKRSQMLSGATEEPNVSGGWPDQQLGRGSFGGSIAGDTGPLPGTPTQSSTPRHYTSASAQAALTASSSFGGMRRRSRQLDKAARALDWERKSLAAGLKWNLTETEREELYRSWGVDPDTKERKLQLVFKLWSKETLQQPDGMARSAELVVMLCGMDASEHMLELVFGGHLREYSAAGLLANRSSSSGLGLAVSNIVRRLAPPLARSGMGTSPMRSSVSVAGGHAGHNVQGVYGPQRTAGSFTSKLQSGFLSLLSSKDKQEGLGSHVPSREGSFSSLASSQAVPHRR